MVYMIFFVCVFYVTQVNIMFLIINVIHTGQAEKLA